MHSTQSSSYTHLQMLYGENIKVLQVTVNHIYLIAVIIQNSIAFDKNEHFVSQTEVLGGTISYLVVIISVIIASRASVRYFYLYLLFRVAHMGPIWDQLSFVRYISK